MMIISKSLETGFLILSAIIYTTHPANSDAHQVRVHPVFPYDDIATLSCTNWASAIKHNSLRGGSKSPSRLEMWALGAAAGFQIHSDDKFDFEKRVTNEEILGAVTKWCQVNPNDNMFSAVEHSFYGIFNKQLRN